MADGAIDKLTIEIGASSTKAATQINNIAKALGQLRSATSAIDGSSAGKIQALATALQGLKGIGTVKIGDKLPDQLRSIVDAANSITDDAISRLERLVAALGGLKGAGTSNLGNLASSGSSWAEQMTARLESQDRGARADLESALDSNDLNGVREVGGALAEAARNGASELLTNLQQVGQTILGNILPAIKSFGGMLKSAASYAAKLAGHILQATGNIAKFAGSTAKSMLGISGLEKAAGNAKKVLNSIGRIAFYRAIRSAIKAVTQAFQEGLKAAYEFSRGMSSEGKRFANAMDSMKAAGSAMKAQLGSAFIALMAIIEPIVNAIISLITKLANAISQLFSAFTGSTYLKAAEVPQQWGEAAGGAAKQAKEWKNQILGFDEINRLEAPADGGAGGGGGSPLAGFSLTDTPINENIKKFVDDLKAAILAGDWQGAGELLGNKINELLPTPEQWKAWGSKLGYGLNGAIQTLYYTLKTIDFTAIGQDIASFLNSALEEIDFEILGRVLIRKITLALDFMLGFLGTLDWGLVGKSIFDFLMGALSEANEWLESKDWEQIGQNFFNKFKELIENINFEELARTFFTFLGLAFGAIAQLLDEFFESAWQSVKDYFKEKMEETGGDAWEGFKKGIVDAITGIGEWVKSNMVDPFLDAVKKPLGIHSPSTVLEAIGKDAVEGFKIGFDTKWQEFRATVDQMINTFVSFVQNAVSQIGEMLSGIGGRIGGFFGGIGLDWFASGGFPEDGLFMANHGELVGKFSNGKTAVANNEQITAGIASAVYDAFVAAISDVSSSGGGNGKQTEFVLNINGREFARAIYDDQNAVQKEYGVSYLESA